MNKQVVSVRLTKEANKVLSKWKKKYSGLNKSEAIQNVDTILWLNQIAAKCEECNLNKRAE